MSDVDALSSLPAAPDTGKSALANNVKPQSLPGPSPPKVASPKPVQPRDSDVAPKSKVDSADDGDQPLSPKADSEAETIIQSGRESVSPEKRRKFIQHDPKRRDARNDKFNTIAEDRLPANGDRVRRKTSAGAQVRRDRSSHARDSTRSSDSPDRSPARSPARNRPLKRASPSAVKKEKAEDSSSSSVPDHRAKSLPRGDKPSISRKRSFSECGNEDADEYHSRTNRLPASRGRTNGDLNGVSLPRPASIDRSVSPVRPFHKRTVSGPQLGAGSDATSKRRKAPTPLLTGFSRQGSEDRHSISSSTSGSPLPSAHVRKITALDGASASPARVMGPKKQRDQNGRTRLARACAAQELDTAIARHAERPEDLNVADNAGNTPLQIAALEGSAPIVKFLIEVGCDLDTRNIDKDTPLIDAVENGHLDVVKILLDAGINPRAVNAEGDEPYELVPTDCEDYDEIRRIIAEAKAAPRPGRRSEERKDTPLPRASVPSPRDSPPVEKGGPRSPILNAPVPRRRTGRSEVTRNDLLWTKATPENLQAFAARGDMAGVATILNVGQKADPESMIAAAKGGHDEVLSLMLGIGFADPDPDPVHASGQKAGYNTPMLAAIGRGNLAVIRLLLDQPGFNPTRRLFRDCTYYELSRDRKGENWEEESDLLKSAYDNYTGKKKSRKAEHSSPRRPRDREKDSNRHTRRDSRSPVVRSRKVAGSPNRRESALKERKRDSVALPREKSGTARPKAPRRDSSDNESENRMDVSRPKPKEDDSEATHRGDGQPKRRRLIAGRPPQDRRQNSLPSSDSMSGREENVKPSETTAPAKRGPTLKRIRSSESPHRSSHAADAEQRPPPPPEAQKKKRRVLSEDGAPTNGSVKKSHDASADVPPKSHPRPKRDEDHSHDGPHEQGQPASHKPSVSSQQKGVAVPKPADRSVVKEEKDKLETHELEDIPMEDSTSKGNSKADEQEEAARREAKKNKAAEAQRELQATLAAENARKAEEERAALLARDQQQAEDERRRKEAEQRRQKQAEEERQKKLEQERARVAKMRKEQEEKEQRRREALPNRLRVAAELVGSNDPRAKSHTWLKRFMPLVTAQTKQLDPQCDASVAEEKWIPNYLVAPLLATNDLQLSQYVSWEKRTVTPTQRANLWRVTRRMLVPAEDTEASGSSMGQILQKDCATRPKYFEMEHVFWVKLSDFMDIIPHLPHLHGLNIQFLRMHIDNEPLADEAMRDSPQPNGHHLEPADVNGFPAGNKGLANGYGATRPSTYV